MYDNWKCLAKSIESHKRLRGLNTYLVTSSKRPSEGSRNYKVTGDKNEFDSAMKFQIVEYTERLFFSQQQKRGLCKLMFKTNTNIFACILLFMWKLFLTIKSPQSIRWDDSSNWS